MKLEIKLCQCVRTIHEFAATFGGQICDLIRDDICTRKVRNSKPYLDCSTKCRVACEEIRYDLKLSSLAVDKSTYGTGKDKFSFIIKFSSDTQKVSEYQPNLPVIEAFGFFGGYIGIWLGFSLLSVLLGVEAKLMKAISRKTEKYVS
ncbi:uncharacterized protein LOC121047760 [Ixodes scapularis]|uniref:uncharacterized protein LOC121047760 n=1 Tax=Ixodes scapularis TaxID=6945 RepID=UPI001AD6DAF1|nr:uncharacterized protein LOC121047760 [Ixodes scapularis]